MRKFTIVSKKGETLLQEVEIELVTAIEDPSIMWALRPGEYRAKVLKPESFYEKKKDGTMVPPVWCSHAFFNSEAEARGKAEKDLEVEMQRVARKSHVEFDVVACLARCKEIKTATL